MKYAVIRSGGKQYIVSEGEEIIVDKIDAKAGDKYKFAEILMVNTGDNISIGQPLLEKASVSGSVVEQLKGEKVTTIKFKSKVHYRRKTGFRAQLTKIKIQKVEV